MNHPAQSSHNQAEVFAGAAASAGESIIPELSCCWDKTCVSIISFGKGALVNTRASCGHLIGKQRMVLDSLSVACCHDIMAKIVKHVESKDVWHENGFCQLYALTEWHLQAIRQLLAKGSCSGYSEVTGVEGAGPTPEVTGNRFGAPAQAQSNPHPSPVPWCSTSL